MNRSDTFIVAKEGWGLLAALLILFGFFGMIDAGFFQFVAFVAFVCVGYIYRNPERIVPFYQAGSIVAVADGVVTAIDTADECRGHNTPCYKIELQSGYLDASLLRAPFGSRITSARLIRGNRLPLQNPLSVSLNEKALYQFTSEDGQVVACEHLLEQSPADLCMYASFDERMSQGARYGIMLKGNHTIYLPLQSRVAVKVGDRVRAGESLIGYFS